jgi:hypothetical protein
MNNLQGEESNVYSLFLYAVRSLQQSERRDINKHTNAIQNRSKKQFSKILNLHLKGLN